MKKTLFTIIFLLTVVICFAHNSNTTSEITHTFKTGGISLGSAIAVAISWDKNKSILFAILHGLLSWLYVIFFALMRNK